MPKQKPTKELHNVKEAADVLGVSEARVKVFCKDGRLPAFKVGRAWIIRAADLEAFRGVERTTGRPRAK